MVSHRAHHNRHALTTAARDELAALYLFENGKHLPKIPTEQRFVDVVGPRLRMLHL